MSELEERFQKIVAEVRKSEEKDCYQLSLSLEDTSSWDSKIGGVPYLPKGETIPTKKDGETPLRFLAQVNLDHLTADIFPLKSGVIQFWIADDDLYGMDFEDGCSQKNFRVLYYPEVKDCYSVSQMRKLFPSLQSEVTYGLPIDPTVSIKLSATRKKEAITYDDYHFDLLFVEKYNATYPDSPISVIYDLLTELNDDVVDEVLDEDTAGHKLLGYPNFTQSDPREDANQDYILLFQLDSEGVRKTFTNDDGSEFEAEEEILWGDCGIGNWFIKKEDLEKGDFSKVLYNWDCC